MVTGPPIRPSTARPPAAATSVPRWRRPGRWSVVVLAATLIVIARPARACTGCSNELGVAFRSIRPAFDQAGVPLNTRVWVTYETHGNLPAVGPLLLRPKGGEPVDVEILSPAVAAASCGQRKVVVLRPRQPLQPGTVYEVLDRVALVPCRGPGCESATPKVFADFTTAGAADSEPPRFKGIQRSEGTTTECGDSACCGPYKASQFSLVAIDAMDAGGIAGYEVSVGGQAVDFLASPGLSGFMFCSGEAVKGPPEQLRPAGRYRFNAVDLAGNRDSNTRDVSVSPSCGGCSYGGGRTEAPLVVLLALLGALLRPSGTARRRVARAWARSSAI
jgi:hypothetical protein